MHNKKERCERGKRKGRGFLIEKFKNGIQPKKEENVICEIKQKF